MGSRSREGAWIEIEDIFKLGFVTINVAPVRERGLKSVFMIEKAS